MTFEEWCKAEYFRTGILWSEDQSRAAYRAGQREMRENAAGVAELLGLPKIAAGTRRLPLEGDDDEWWCPNCGESGEVTQTRQDFEGCRGDYQRGRMREE